MRRAALIVTMLFGPFAGCGDASTSGKMGQADAAAATGDSATTGDAIGGPTGDTSPADDTGSISERDAAVTTGDARIPGDDVAPAADASVKLADGLVPASDANVIEPGDAHVAPPPGVLLVTGHIVWTTGGHGLGRAISGNTSQNGMLRLQGRLRWPAQER